MNIFWIFIFLVPFTKAEQTACMCDGDSTNQFSSCFIDVVDGEINHAVDPQGCECSDTTWIYYIAETDDPAASEPYVVSCGPETTTQLPTTTVFEEDPVEETYVEGTCGTTALTEGKKDIMKYILMFCSIWIILWTIGTIITNIVCKSNGHHRAIGIVEEIGIILMFIFLGFFTFDPLDNETFCKVTTILLHFFIVFVVALFVFEAVFARSIINGSSEKNGTLPPVVNYILPIPIALIPCLITFFTLKDHYALGLHCFISVGSDMLWAFVIPTWLVFMGAITVGQLAFLACRQFQHDVDRDQLYWAFKCCKYIPIFTSVLISIYYLAAFALDMQKFWLIIVYLVLCLVFGPVIFVLHTSQYKNTAKKLFKSTQAPFYKPCGNEFQDDNSPIPNDPINNENPPSESKPPRKDSLDDDLFDDTPTKPPNPTPPGTVPESTTVPQ